MSNLKLNTLDIKNYRSLENVHVEKLGRLNLITGRNNVGKSSLLEAVRLWASRTDANALLDIIEARDESLLPDNEIKPERDERQGDNSLLGCLCLFAGYPTIDLVRDRIEIVGNGATLSISIIEKEMEQENLPGLQQQLDSLFTRTKVLELSFDSPQKSVYLSLPAYYSRYRRQRFREPRFREKQVNIPCVSLGSSTLDSIESFSTASLWDNIALTDKEEFVLRGLKLIEPRIDRINFIQGGRLGRFPVIRVSGIDRPIPLHGLGDGVTRIFEIMLALVNAENGFLLIDEFENGLHYSVQAMAWETVLELATILNIQVFATSHSNDCVEAFEVVSENAADEMVLIRLTRGDEGVRAETLSSSKLSRRLELGREVR
ncbi:MAG: AAA family ATPase [Candidatus Hydrogenedentes bacterium]|nr:AAA family ATPase [Candidatus Hydrogenedentota bacterium]